MSVGFLHTPNFAAFWPKPRKKKILGQCAGIMQTVLHLTPPCRCQAPVQNRKKKNIEKSKDSGTMCWYHANSSPPYPPCRCQAPVPKPKKHREIERFCPKPKKTSRDRKKAKKTKDSGTMCWYHVNILLARFFFWIFSISRGFFRFWTLSISRCFFDFGWFFFDFGHLLLISRCFYGCLQQKLQHRTALQERA